MARSLEFIACLVTLVVAEARRVEIRSITGEDALLRCTADSQPGVPYRSVIWYKVDEDFEQLTGLLRKRLTENDTKVEKYKGVEREIMLLDSSRHLLLYNVTTEDEGIYRCFLSAPLGHRNQHGETFLKVYEPPTEEKMKIYLVCIAVTGLATAFIMFAIGYQINTDQEEAVFSEDATPKEYFCS